MIPPTGLVSSARSVTLTVVMRSIVVLGPFRGGTSLVTGILQSLGVFVGERFIETDTGYETYEGAWLQEQCLKCFDESPENWGYLGDRGHRVSELRVWHQWAINHAASLGVAVVGGKHPTMCMLVDELATAWANSSGQPPLFIAVRRPVGEVVDSWLRAKTPDGDPWWPREDVPRIVTDLVETRDRTLARHKFYDVDFRELRQAPDRVIRGIAEACELSPEKVPQATELVRT